MNSCRRPYNFPLRKLREQLAVQVEAMGSQNLRPRLGPGLITVGMYCMARVIGPHRVVQVEC
jgi:hypothetical protein